MMLSKDKAELGLVRYGSSAITNSLYKAVPLFGAAYMQSGSRLLHIVDVSESNLKSLCGRVREESLMDDSTQWKDPSSATCSKCVRDYQELKKRGQA